MTPIEKIKNMAKSNGFSLNEKIPLEEVGLKNDYLYVFKKKWNI